MEHRSESFPDAPEITNLVNIAVDPHRMTFAWHNSGPVIAMWVCKRPEVGHYSSSISRVQLFDKII